MEFEIIQYYGKNASRCGYCKNTNSSLSHGMHAYKMSTGTYQDLIDRGWRRSGQYCYKPDNKTTCCPCYTIKCDTLEFKLSKSHKKILKRMTRFLRDGKKDKSEEVDAKVNSAAYQEADNVDGRGIVDEPKAPDVHIKDLNLDAVAAANPERHAAAMQRNEHLPTLAAENETSTDSFFSAISDQKQPHDGHNPPCKKAKQMRLERRQAKLAAKGVDPLTTTTATTKANASKEKTLADFIADSNANDKHKLKLELVHVKSQKFAKTQASTYALYQKYQTRIHNDPPGSVKEYLDFLQCSPLQYNKTPIGPPAGYGSFHQQYWLDDKLIAVGVIDILPHCLSSVYFFYDPDYSFLSLGTYGSLREIELVQQLAVRVPALKYYYMGFYIHSCPKMRYKGKLSASYLLCPESYTWHLLTDAMRAKLDMHKYQRFNDDPHAKDVNDFLEQHLDSVLLLVDLAQCITYRQHIQSSHIQKFDNILDIIKGRIYKEITGNASERDTILEYGKLVGKPCAHRLLYVM